MEGKEPTNMLSYGQIMLSMNGESFEVIMRRKFQIYD
jgi:hypothetical protein